MAKQLLSLRYIYKINTTYLDTFGWDIKLNPQVARQNEMLVSMASSQTIRFIDEITNSGFSEKKVKYLKNKIKKVKKQKTSSINRNKLINYNEKLDKLLLVEDYVCVVMDSDEEYDRANEGFKINGKTYRRLLSTSGGVKSSVIIYANESIYEELMERVNCGRDMTKEFVPGKLSAYMGLTCSASIPVTDVKNVLVVHDCETEFLSKVIEIDDSKSKYPIVQEKDNYPIKLNVSDGFGLVTYDLAKTWASDLELDYVPSGFTIRNAYTKGMMFVFPFREFAEEVAKEFIVKDVWGNEHDIRDIDMVLTTSMLKLWDSYKSWEHYRKCYKKYKYTFGVTKTTPKELDEERNLNYQFIQSLKLNDEMIDNLIKPTVDEIKEILGGDFRKTLIYTKGMKITEDDAKLTGHSFVQALMVDNRVMDDPYIKGKIREMIRTRVNDAKIGVLKVRGNYQILSGDPYALCQSIFGMEVTGLLKAGELYSKHWSDRGVNKVTGFRAPMTCMNNIVLMNVANNDEMSKWYRYMDKVVILNAWDTTTASLNGADFDGDTIFTTDNEIIKKGVVPSPAIFCIQKAAAKKICTEDDFIKADKLSFGDEIGSITNRITTMFDILAKFEPSSEEYKELEYRIMTGQHYQQCSIDKAKGIISNSMPKEWYSASANKIKESDTEEDVKRKEFNMKILADKKPYFFLYNYKHLKKKHKDVCDTYNTQSICRFGISIDELCNLDNLTEEQEILVNMYKREYPVHENNCVMNKICWKVEEELNDLMAKRTRTNDFDYTIYKGNFDVKPKHRMLVEELFNEYVKEVREYNKKPKEYMRAKKTGDELANIRMKFVENFKQKAESICSNEYELCDIVLDICYANNHKKQFAWTVSENIMIENLLSKNGHKFKCPIQDKDGDIIYCGKNFILKEVEVLEHENCN